MIWLDVFMPDNCLKASSTHRLQGTHSHCGPVTLGILIHGTTVQLCHTPRYSCEQL